MFKLSDIKNLYGQELYQLVFNQKLTKKELQEILNMVEIEIQNLANKQYVGFHKMSGEFEEDGVKLSRLAVVKVALEDKINK